MGELVSIIIPLYNVEKYLKRCIDSVINQTYKNLEIILVDDGSVDGSPKIADVYARDDKRVIALHKENGGTASARNLGLDSAHGRYVTFIDADDWIDSKYIETLYNACESGADVAETDYVVTSGETVPVEYEKDVLIKSGKELYQDREYYFSTRAVVPWNKLYSAKCFENLRFNEDKYSEDVFTVFKAVYPCKSVAVLKAKPYYYFDNENGKIKAPLTLKKIDGIEGYSKQYKYFAGQNDNVACAYAAEKIYRLIAYYYALSGRKGVNDRKAIVRKLKEYYREFYKKFKGTVKVKRLEKLLIKLSCGNLAVTYPLARHRRNRIS